MKYLYAVILVICFNFSMADVVQITAIPSGWKLENYVGNNNVVAWYAGSTCTSGLVQFPNNATSEDKNRFWSVVMAGKLSGKEIFVRYDNATSNCEIQSFGLVQE